MMKKIILCCLISLVFFVSLSHKCQAEPLSSLDLINNAKRYDGKGVTYRGEIIGDIMIRGENVWLNLNDGSNAIGIWAAKSFLGDIKYAGGYGVKGDVIEVNGVFNRSCAEHGGDLDIHLQSITKITSGQPYSIPAGKKKIYAAFFLCILIILSYLLKS